MGKKPAGGYPLGKRTTQPHAKDGWTVSRDSDGDRDRPNPKGDSGRENTNGYHLGRGRRQ